MVYLGREHSAFTHHGAYLGMGTSAVRGSTEKDQATAHLDVRPCNAWYSELYA